MLELARRMGGEPEIVVGYRNSDTFLTDDLKAYGNLTIASDDGSIGTKGTVIDAIRENGIKGDIIYACGPTPMLRGIKAYAEENNIEAYISLEEKWHAESARVLPVYVRQQELTTTLKSTMPEYARMVLYLMPRRLIFNEY